MRFVYLGNFDSPHNTESYIADALDRACYDVVRLNEATTNEDVLSANLHRDDVLLFAKGRVRGEWDPQCVAIQDAIAQARCLGFRGRVVCWVFDLLAEDFAPDRREWADTVSMFADHFFVTDGSTKIDGSKVLRQGAIQTSRRPGYRPEDKEFDVLYLGHPYRERRQVYDRLAVYYGTRMRSCFEGTVGDDLADLIESAAVVFGPLYPGRAGYWSNRVYVVTGCCGCFVAPEIEGMREEGWIPGKHYIPYDGTASGAIEVIDEALMQPGLRSSVATEGQRLCLGSFTYDHRVASLLKAIG